MSEGLVKTAPLRSPVFVFYDRMLSFTMLWGYDCQCQRLQPSGLGRAQRERMYQPPHDPDMPIAVEIAFYPDAKSSHGQRELVKLSRPA